jgi:hypothetical protein
MATVRFAEGRIAAVEGFVVHFRYEGPAKAKGRDVRGDRRNVPTYPYRRAAPGETTVAAWAGGRFRKAYPGFGVDVLDGRGQRATGQTLLRTVRATYD